jgi:hypothetical protein
LKKNEEPMKNLTSVNKMIVTAIIVTACLSSLTLAVTSKINRHTSAKDFLKGTTDKTSVDSDGSIRLSRQTEPIELGKLLDNAWSINSIAAVPKDAVYLGTSPNGRIIKYKKGKATMLYEPAPDKDHKADTVGTPFLNLHVFALAADAKGRVLAAISGAECKLLRFDGKKHDVIFQSETEKYIFAIAIDKQGNVFLGTGPNGKIYMLDSRGNKSKLVADLADKNVLSLAIGPDSILYAGTDQRGLVYKIDLSSQKTSVLYDTDQLEVASLIFDDNGYLYAAATSAHAARQQDMFTSLIVDSSPGGRPDSGDDSDDGEAKGSTDITTTLEIPNAKDASPKKTKDSSLMTKRGKLPRSAGHIYKITPDGFVTDVFSEMAVIFSMVMQNDSLLLGTGNNAQLFSVDPETENKTIDYEHSQASQITALAVDDDSVFIGTANPPKLIKLSTAYASSGSFTSELVDAEQPAKWGKLQIDADMPSGCKIFLSARSGNLADPNDSAFSEWTDPVKITNATQLECSNARFCQYKLIIENKDNTKTPVIRQVALAHMVPNLAPKVLSVDTERSEDKKENMIITFKSKDDNKDKLLYDIHFRKLGRKKWIELEDDAKEPRFEWNTNTVEDGKYEIMITANDKLSNTQTTKLSAFRISDPVVIDNAPPVIEKEDLDTAGQKVTLSLNIKDSLTVIGNLSYTVDSNDDWISTLPDDQVYDTTYESFVIVLNDLDAGEHVIAVKIADDLGNTTYKTYDVDIKSKK